MEPELVVYPEEGGVDLLLGDPPGGADILAAVVAVAHPKHLVATDSLPVQGPALAAEYHALHWGVPSWPVTLMFVPFTLQFLDGLEGVSVDDGRVGGLRVMLLPLPVVFYLTGGEGVGGVGFLPEGVPDVPLVGKDVGDSGVSPLPVRFADPHQDALPVEPGRDLLHTLTGQIVSEDLPDDVRPLLVNLNFPVPEDIAEGDGGREEGAALHAHLVAPAHIFRDVLALPLCHGGEYGGEQLAAHVGRVDMLLLEAHPHADGLQLPDGTQAVPGVAGEPGDGLDQHLIHPPAMAVRQEALEIRALLRRGACDALISHCQAQTKGFLIFFSELSEKMSFPILLC